MVGEKEPVSPEKEEFDLSPLKAMKGLPEIIQGLVNTGQLNVENITKAFKAQRETYVGTGFARKMIDMERFTAWLGEGKIGPSDVAEAAGAKEAKVQAPKGRGGISGGIQRGLGRLVGRKP